MKRIALVFLIAGTSGCLSSTHIIPRRELQGLAQVPPAERGRRVRVVQGFQGADEPPAAPRVESTTVVVIATPGPPAPRGGGGHGSHSAKLASKEGKFWIIVAATAAIGLAVTEGARFDGWVELHPMHPVHMYGPYGEYTWMPLAHVDSQTAAWARKAFVREEEGPWRRLERAPLNRVGWTYALLLGASELPSADASEERGFMGHIQFGVFPTQVVGILLDAGLGWGKNSRDFTVFDSRWALELQALPLAAGPVHVGGFGQVGIARRLEDGPGGSGEQSFFYAGGALLQLELTTRLALTARAGANFVYDETISDFTVGISIY